MPIPVTIPEYRYRLNEDTARWEVVQRRADGRDGVVQDYPTAEEAREHVVRVSNTGNETLKLPS